MAVDASPPEPVGEPPAGTGFWDDLDTLRALMHPLRMRAYVEAVKGPVSAKELAGRFEVPLQRMSYHVRLLAESGLLRVVRKTPKRGAIETHYRAVATLDVDDDALMSSPELLKVWTHMLLRLLAEDAEHAVDDGAAAAPEFLLSRAHFCVDDAGRARLLDEIAAFYDRMAELEAQLRVEPADDSHSLNVVLVTHPGTREAGRNGPIISQMGTTRQTIPPD